MDRVKFWTYEPYGFIAKCELRSMAWALIRNACVEKGLEIPTLDKIVECNLEINPKPLRYNKGKSLLKEAMKRLAFLAILLGVSACSKFKNEYDFRNYLRDQHPYAIIEPIEEFKPPWHYIVADTINEEVFIYKAGTNGAESHRIALTLMEKQILETIKFKKKYGLK